MTAGFLPLMATALLVCLGFFGYPLARAFLHGLSSAKEPGHRVTPVPAWTFFRRTFWRRIRVWVILWVFGLIALFALTFYLGDGISAPYRLLSALEGFSMFAWMPLALAAAHVALAPRCRRIWTLQALSIPLALAAYVLSFVAFTWASRSGWGAVVVSMGGSAGVRQMRVIMLAPMFNLAASIVVLGLACLWARRKGECWFRFEE